jgi:uncharacterized protein
LSIPVAGAGKGGTVKFVMESTPLPPDGAPPTPPPPLQGGLSKDEKNLAMLAHLLAFSVCVMPFFGNIIGPLVLWLLKKDTRPFVEHHAKEALNFNITVTIAVTVCLSLFILFLPLLIAAAIGIAAVVLTIIAAVKASEGVQYRYPLTLRLVK